MSNLLEFSAISALKSLYKYSSHTSLCRHTRYHETSRALIRRSSNQKHMVNVENNWICLNLIQECTFVGFGTKPRFYFGAWWYPRNYIHFLLKYDKLYKYQAFTIWVLGLTHYLIIANWFSLHTCALKIVQFAEIQMIFDEVLCVLVTWISCRYHASIMPCLRNYK